MYPDYQTLDMREVDFLYHIKKELSLESTREAVSLAASVFQTLRQALPLKSTNALLNKLPDFLKLAFVANWRRNEGQANVSHLDELVGLLMDREKNNSRSYFRNEVQALSIVILTLKQLDKLVDLHSIEGISSSLLHELKNVPAEAAA